MTIPADLEAVIAEAWRRARSIEGYLGERECRALGMLAAASRGPGVAVEIGSFKGKSTVVLATVRAHYGLGAVVSIDPHNAPSSTDPDLKGQKSSLSDFTAALRASGVERLVEVHCQPSREAASGWNRPIGLLWIDGDHTYAGTKEDFDRYSPFLTQGAVVAFHDTLHEFDGPIRVFVENVLRSDDFGPAGVLHTIGWAQYRPRDGARFRRSRERLAARAARLIPFVARGHPVEGFLKLRYKLRRSLVPHDVPAPAEWARRFSMSFDSPPDFRE